MPVGEWHDEWERIVDSATAFDLGIVNTLFEKKVSQCETHKGRGQRKSTMYLRPAMTLHGLAAGVTATFVTALVSMDCMNAFHHVVGI